MLELQQVLVIDFGVPVEISAVVWVVVCRIGVINQRNRPGSASEVCDVIRVPWWTLFLIHWVLLYVMMVAFSICCCQITEGYLIICCWYSWKTFVGGSDVTNCRPETKSLGWSRDEASFFGRPSWMWTGSQTMFSYMVVFVFSSLGCYPMSLQA